MCSAQHGKRVKAKEDKEGLMVAARDQIEQSDAYVKYTHFLSLEELNVIKDWAKEKGVRMYKARDMPCEPLHPQRKIGYVAPKVWDRSCRRQGSWYRESSQAGKYLLISSFRMEHLHRGTKLSISDFSALRLPSKNVQMEMVQSTIYQRKKPGEWEKLSDNDMLRFKMARSELCRLYGLNSGQMEEELHEVFVTHCANHSNFLAPRYYITEGSEIYPYSIADTPHVCSSCAEFFNLLGQEYRLKFVTPCTGAVIGAKLPLNKYVKVKNL